MSWQIQLVDRDTNLESRLLEDLTSVGGFCAIHVPGPIGGNYVAADMIDCPQTREVTANYVDDVDAYLQHSTNRRQLLPQLVTDVDVGRATAYLLNPKSKGIGEQSIVINAGTPLMLIDQNRTCELHESS